MIVPVAMPSVVRRASCHEAWLWMKGIFGVRIMWMTNVCDQSDSTNQPIRKIADNRQESCTGVNRGPLGCAIEGGEAYTVLLKLLEIQKFRITNVSLTHKCNYGIISSLHVLNARTIPKARLSLST